MIRSGTGFIPKTSKCLLNSLYFRRWNSSKLIKKAPPPTPTVSYEYPKNPNYNIPPHVLKKSNDNLVVRYQKYIPIIAALGMGAWGLYTLYYFSNPSAGQKEGPLLKPDKFTEFVISNRIQVDDDHYVIELAPKNKKGLLSGLASSGGYWNGSEMWSVEVKQPQIMVVRNYTPLPFVITKSKADMSTGLRLITPEIDTGKFCIYVKKYPHGEVARWLCKKQIGEVIEIRGPFVEFKFPPQKIDKYSKFERPRMQNLASKVPADPYVGSFLPKDIPEPENMVFFGAGTGLAPILQLLLSPNPFKGHTFIHLSVKSESQIPSEFLRMLYFLSKMGRVSYTIHQDGKDPLSLKDIPAPSVALSGDLETQLELIKQRLLQIKYQELNEGAEIDVQEKQALQKQYKDLQDRLKQQTRAAEARLDSIQAYSDALHQGYMQRNEPKKDPALAVVCGPEGYVAYVSGRRPSELEQGPVGGLLKEKGWDESNVFKM